MCLGSVVGFWEEGRPDGRGEQGRRGGPSFSVGGASHWVTALVLACSCLLSLSCSWVLGFLPCCLNLEGARWESWGLSWLPCWLAHCLPVLSSTIRSCNPPLCCLPLVTPQAPPTGPGPCPLFCLEPGPKACAQQIMDRLTLP